MKIVHGVGKSSAQINALFGRQGTARVELRLQCPWRVVKRSHILAHHLIISKLHDVVKIATLIVAANMKHIDQSVMPSRNSFVTPNAVKFTLIGAGVLKQRTLHDLDCTPCTQYASSQPHLPITATRDLDHQLIFRNVKNYPQGEPVPRMISCINGQ